MGAFENQTGKVSAEVFKSDLLNRLGARRSDVIQGPQFGVDTSVIDLGNDRELAVSSDPLSLIPSLGMKVSAWLSVHLLVNDMCTTGFVPQHAQFVLNLPPSLSREHFNSYWGEINQLCDDLNIAITGGHTGQVPGQESTISGGGTMFLSAPKGKILTSNHCRAGDVIIATKSAALSSSSLLSRAFPTTVKQELGEDVQERASDNFWQLSVLKESQAAVKVLTPNRDLHAMHDVTEGGVLGAIDEMAQASGLGFDIDADAVPVDPETRQVTELFGIDPLYSVGAGCMLMAVSPDSAQLLLKGLDKEGIKAASIGTFRNDEKRTVNRNGASEDFSFDGNDPYWTAFFKALKEGWT
ncbi:MAG: AIR synthase family protein [Bacteroidota bacterium]